MKSQKNLFVGILSAITMFISFSCLSSNEEKKEEKLRYPYDCTAENYYYHYYTLILNPSQKYEAQSIYFVHNTSSKIINLLQTKNGDEPYIMHMKTTIKPNMWSVLAMDEKQISIICTWKNEKASREEVLNCKNLLDICEFTHSKFGDNHRGNYWVVENNTMMGAKRATRYHGVLLIDPKKVKQDKAGEVQ